MSEFLSEKINQRSFIAAPPEKVYQTITSATEWDKFFTTGMELDPTPGGVCAFAWKDWGPDKYTLRVPGKVIEVKVAELFSFKWGVDKKATTVKFELEASNSGTIVTCSESGFRNNEYGRAAIVDCASGWGEAVTLMKFYLEHGVTY